MRNAAVLAANKHLCHSQVLRRRPFQQQIGMPLFEMAPHRQACWRAILKKAKGLEPNQPGVTPGVKDNPSMILIDRCQVMKENPPGDDWNGIYVMTSK